MQNPNTPEWLELFTTAFGAKGLVALAWWAGAYHAERIRNLQVSYPILLINGDAGSGKSTLVNNLWILSGAPHCEELNPRNHTFSGLLVQLTKAANEPVVINGFDTPPDSEHFDWDALKPHFSTGAVRHTAGGEPVHFRGALAIVGAGPNILKSRCVEVNLKSREQTAERSAAVQALYDLHISELEGFLATVKAHQDMAIFCMGKAEALAFELADKVSIELNIRDARNHAQLIALLDFLDTLFHVPADALEAAKASVREMAWHTVGRTRGPIED
ncbi:hypothetical protein [Pseudomonas sp. URMO17WK12:I4]|uniref:hypothetical protein n=1 Tax=Pseudomonas sp. URMO17WK12:I4 TaxID=1283292 RepID=UPI0004B3C9E5|nr:hypothetical protein [Pseudomonas sp. URMO17WK12:I4]